MSKIITRILLIVLTMAPVAAEAQDASKDLSRLRQSLLADIYVVDDAGRETAGVLLRADPDSLVLMVKKSEQRFDMTGVRQIDKRGDSVIDGAIKGGVTGLILGTLAAAAGPCWETPCISGRAARILVSTGSFTVMGALIDAVSIGRSSLYEAPRAQRLTTHENSLPISKYSFRLGFRW